MIILFSAVLIVGIIVQSSAYVQSSITLVSKGLIEYAGLQVRSSPNPSHVNQSICIFGNLTDSSGIGIPQRTVTMYFSLDQKIWSFLAELWTNQIGHFSFIWKPFCRGQIWIRVNCSGNVELIEHIVADCIVAQDGSGDFSDVKLGIDSLPQRDGVAYIMKGTYTLGSHMNILGKSGIVIIGSGIDSKITKTSGLIFWLENVTNFTVKRLHFHYLTNDNYEAITIKGVNVGITIDSCWFTREAGSPGKYADLIFFDPKGSTQNLHILNCYLENAQIDAIAIKSVHVGMIRNNTIIDAGTNYITGLGSGMTVEKCIDLEIAENRITRTGNQSMGGINIFGDSNKIRVEKNFIRNAEWGANVNHASEISVVQNSISSPFSSGIRLEASAIVYVNENQIVQTESNRETPGIFAIENKNVTISGNYVKNTSSGVQSLHNTLMLICFNNIDLGAQSFHSQGYGIQIYNSSSTQVSNNTVLNAYDIGISVSSSHGTRVLGNTVSSCQKSGVRIIGLNNSIVSQNLLQNNGKDLSTTFGRNGIDVVDCYDCRIELNRAFDSQQTKTQLFGLVESGNSDYNFVIQNDFRFNALGGMKIVGRHTMTEGNLG